MKSSEPTLEDVEHRMLCYSRERMCAHPRQCPIGNFGRGEIAVMHYHAPCRYQDSSDIAHGPEGYKGRACALLQRSLDGGATWPEDLQLVVWDDSLPLETRRAILHKADDPTQPRQNIDLAGLDSMVYFTRTWTGPEGPDGKPSLECFAFRSGDRGRTWEKTPTRIKPPPGYGYVHVDGYPPVKCSDGSLLVAGTVQKSEKPGAGRGNQVIGLYGTDDDGLSWEYLSAITQDSLGHGRPTYAGLLQLPGGLLQCYFLHIDGDMNAICLTSSGDGYTWSPARPIVRLAASPWARHPKVHAWAGARRFGYYYRSPWPLLLADGRIVVLFARRKRPFGIGLIVSEDQGRSWSSEVILRADASDHDIGYPVATQLDDGRIFTAYYYMENDGNNFGGTRYIAASFFRLA